MMRSSRSSHHALLGDEPTPKQAICPLCGAHVPSSELARHRQRDAEELRDYTLQLIRRANPDWVAEDGSCKKCDEDYEQL
jgi:hypothetical protein